MPDIELSVSHKEILLREVPKNEILQCFLLQFTNCELIFPGSSWNIFPILTVVVGLNLP
jgi:hypothetical protein